MVISIKTDQKVTLMMKMRKDHQTLNGAKIGDVRTEGGQSRQYNAIFICHIRHLHMEKKIKKIDDRK